MGLDKFYTKPTVAKNCYDFFISLYPEATQSIFLEPSAGNGVFLPYLNNYIALDLVPEGENIQTMDFFDFANQQQLFTIGNPPFGNRSKMAIDFFNHAAKFSNVIGFIVPVSFMKWSVQKELDKNFRLVDYFYLEPESFTSNGEPFAVRTMFQVWANKTYSPGPDLRLTKQPPITHPDFNIWQYNATLGALKTVEEDWTIATYRQGYHDYNKLFSQEDYAFIKEKMTGIKKQQFFFIKPLNETAENIIHMMDFNALAERNTSTPGFGKGDFVSYYTELKQNMLKSSQ